MIVVGVSIITFHMQYPLLNDYTYRGYICFFVGIFMGSILKNKKDLISKLSLLAIVPLINWVCSIFKKFLWILYDSFYHMAISYYSVTVKYF